MRFVGLPLLTSGHDERLSVTPLESLEVFERCPGHLVPVGLHYGRLSQTA
jgi:hypothetical protein